MNQQQHVAQERRRRFEAPVLRNNAIALNALVAMVAT
jgi:hypothetical protein